MISEELNCIFVHIPKTGGTSIENAIWGPDWSQRTEEQLWMGNVRPGFNKYQSGGLQHLLATQIRKEVGEQKFDSCFRFTFVRNPWDKAVSQYCYIKSRPMLLKHMGLSRWSSFGRYLKVISQDHEKHVQSFEQCKFIFDDQGNRLVDYVGRFETLAQDFRVVADKIGLPNLKLPHDMKSARRQHYSKYYNAKRADVISKVYARDI